MVIPAEHARSPTASCSATRPTGHPSGWAGSRSARARPVAHRRLHGRHPVRALQGGRRGACVERGIHSVIAAPVVRRGGPARASSRPAHRQPRRVRRRRPAPARSARGPGVDRASPTPGSSTGSRRRRRALGRTAESERALREIARRMMVIQDPAELLQDVVDEAARLLGSSGAVIDLLDPATGEVHWAYDAGIEDATRAEWQRRGVGGDGVFLAIRERRVVTTDDYAADERFADGARARRLLRRGRRPLDRVRAAHRRGRRSWARSRCSPASPAGSGRTRRRPSRRSPTSRRSRSTTRS